VLRRAEDDRAVSEAAASWNLQGGLALHFCRGCLQLSPPAESGDASDVSQCQAGLVGPEQIFKGQPAGAAKVPLQVTKSRKPRKILGRNVHFSAACSGHSMSVSPLGCWSVVGCKGEQRALSRIRAGVYAEKRINLKYGKAHRQPADPSRHNPGIQRMALLRNIFWRTGGGKFNPCTGWPSTLRISWVARNFHSRA
jgi:hypothetical protein